jgi:Cytochrome P450
MRSTQSFLSHFFLSADRWKTERKLLNSSFSLPNLQKYIPMFNKCIENSIQHLNMKCDKGEFDIKQDITLVVMNAVMSKKALSANIYIKIVLNGIYFYFNRHNIWKRYIKKCRKSIYGQH